MNILNEMLKISEQILVDFIDTTDFLLYYRMRDLYRAKKLREFSKKYNNSNNIFYKTINNLKRNKTITVTKKNGTTYISLTTLGKTKLKTILCDHLTIKGPIKWDKKWRMVIFDVPESKRHARNIFAAKLKQLGFKMIQKSVFIYPHDCLKALRYIIDIYNLQPYVSLVTALEIDQSSVLVKYFRKNQVL